MMCFDVMKGSELDLMLESIKKELEFPQFATSQHNIDSKIMKKMIDMRNIMYIIVDKK